MVLPIAFIIGALFGSLKAKKRNGNRFDIFHYGATYGIASVLLALVLSILFQRLGLFS
jgi:hypothetical protein